MASKKEIESEEEFSDGESSSESPKVDDKTFKRYLQRGKAFGLAGTELITYVDKLLEQDKERQERIRDKESKKELELEKIRIEEAKIKADQELKKEQIRAEAERFQHEQEEITKREQIRADAQKKDKDSDRSGAAKFFL